MRVLVTGGTGEIGRPAVGSLLAQGHDVHVATRGAQNDRVVEALGARPVRVDLFDARSVRRSTEGVDALVHLATRIPPSAEMGDAAAWADNDRLRQETTGYLVDAALEHRIEAVVLQSYFAVTQPSGDAWIDEDPAGLFERRDWSHISVMASMRAAEDQMVRLAQDGTRAVILRYGSIYSETSEQLQAQVESLRAGSAAIPGRGENYWPYLASDDAGRAVASAVKLATGTYHVVDEDSVTLGEFWATAAHAMGSRAPDFAPNVDGPMAKILVGSWRLSGRAFREASGWSPESPSVRDGWPRAARKYLNDAVGRRPVA